MRLPAQHVTFAGLTIGTAGTWRLEASSPSLFSPVRSAPLTVRPGPPVSLSFDVASPHTVLRTSVGTPLEPPLIARLLDANGNNATDENATAHIRLFMPAHDGSGGGEALNGGALLGNATAVADHGVAIFDNVRFDDADTRKRLVAVADGLTNATTPLIQVLPGPPTQLVVRTQPRRVYGVPPPPPSTATDPAGIAAALAGGGGGALPVQTIRIDVALLDALGNDACSHLMQEDECTAAARSPPLAVGLTLIHLDFVNYTTAPLAAATRTASRVVTFDRQMGRLGASFDDLHVYRAAADLVYNVTVFAAPVRVDAEGVPLQPPLFGEAVRTDPFDMLSAGTPASLVFVPEPDAVYMSGEPWSALPAVHVLDVYGELCATFDGTVQISVSGLAPWSNRPAL